MANRKPRLDNRVGLNIKIPFKLWKALRDKIQVRKGPPGSKEDTRRNMAEVSIEAFEYYLKNHKD